MRLIVLTACVALVGLSACTEKPQTASARKPDTKAWDAPKAAFVEPGWKAGDAVSWEEQMRQRAQNQNEYSRAVATAP
jgi:hypothetical protein